MVTLHKLFAMFLCGVFLSISATVSAGSLKLTDVPPDHWAYDAVAQLSIDGYIMPSFDNTFHGELKANRYDLAYMVGIYLKKHGGVHNKTIFSDIPARHPVREVIDYSASVMPGYADGTYRGDEEITRFQLALVMSDLLGENSMGHSTFKDVSSDHWAYNAVSNVGSHRIMSGYSDNTFRGSNGMTRYELAQMFAKFCNR